MILGSRQPGEDPTAPVKTHVALWDDALWARIRAVRRRSLRGARGGQVKRLYPFRRLVVCDRCGARMYGEAHSHKGQPPLLGYGCITARERHDCEQRFIANKAIETQVGNALARVSAFDFDDWGSVAAALSMESAPPPSKIDTARIERQIVVESDLYRMGAITHEECECRTRALRAQLPADMPARGMNAEKLARAADLIKNLGRVWEGATDAEHAEWARELFVEVRVKDRRIVSVTPTDSTLLPVFAAYVVASLANTGAPPDGRQGPETKPVDILAWYAAM